MKLLKKKAIEKKKRGGAVRVNIIFENPPIMENYSEPEFNASMSNTQKKKKGLPCSSNGKESACNARDQGSIPGSGRSSEGNGYPR